MLVLYLVIVSVQIQQLTSQGWSSQYDESLPLGTLVMKAPSAGEVGALVSREASSQVLVHGHAWGLFTRRPMSSHVRRTFRPKAGAATGLARQSTLLADQGTGGWKHRWPGPAAPAGPWLPTHTRLHTSGPSGMGTFQWQGAVLAPKPRLRTSTCRLAF